jgi:hypothetical protein
MACPIRAMSFLVPPWQPVSTLDGISQGEDFVEGGDGSLQAASHVGSFDRAGFFVMSPSPTAVERVVRRSR